MGSFSVHDGLQREVGDELVGDEFRREQLGDDEDLVPGDGEEEGDGVEDVAEDELEGERVDAEAFADPCEEAVDRGDEGDDGEDVCSGELEISFFLFGKRIIIMGTDKI